MAASECRHVLRPASRPRFSPTTSPFGWPMITNFCPAGLIPGGPLRSMNCSTYLTARALTLHGVDRATRTDFRTRAHLGHLSWLTPAKPDESLKFIVDVMHDVTPPGESVYLRAGDELRSAFRELTASKTAGMEHMAARPEARRAPLERRVASALGYQFRYRS